MLGRTMQRFRVSTLSLVAGVATFALVATPARAQVRQAGEPALMGELASVRMSLDKYRDPLAAVRDGYFSTLSCIDFPSGANDGGVTYKPGAMGVHLLNMANVGPTLDPMKPQVLIYEPVGEKLRLAAAEWFIPAQLVKDGNVPTVFGQKLQGPMPGHEPIMPAALQHYDLHVWLWKENPAGTFEPTNAKVVCPKGGYTHAEGHSHAMKH